MIPQMMPGLRLQGFNNLTKTLSFNSYDIGYSATAEQQERYRRYLDETYNTERLTAVLRKVAHLIGATILHITRQDYDPNGASVTLLLSEAPIDPETVSNAETPGPLPEAVLCHLDKSHITAHTYPENYPDNGISTFRADIDVSTCGRISPLKALNYLIHSFKSDTVLIDYRVRGFIRDTVGKKHFIDHPIHSIQNYLSNDTRIRYQMRDVNINQEHSFYTKMFLKDFDLNDYLFGADKQDFSRHQQLEIKRRIRREMTDIFYGENLPEHCPSSDAD